MVDVANESLTIAHQSRNIETRESRLRVARETLDHLLDLIRDYPEIKIETLPRFRRDIAAVAAATEMMKQGRHPPKV